MQIFHVKYEKKERCNMSYMVCHGMKSKAGDIKNIEKALTISLGFEIPVEIDAP